ncbi:MAG: helix-turn-helix domain-containing protein [Candidatus Hodarchaeales archaeon]|jgi:predicted transcriptional regulator
MDNDEIFKKILGSLENIEDLLYKIDIKLDKAVNQSEKIETISSLDIVNILQNVDENLIPTIRALFVLQNGGTAEEIATKTGRSRTRENQHLNKLTQLNYVKKIREGREIKFKLVN